MKTISMIEIDSFISSTESVLNSLMGLESLSDKGIKEVYPTLCLINPEVKNFYGEGSPSLEGVFTKVWEGIKAMWHWLVDKIKMLFRFITRSKDTSDVDKKDTDALSKVNKETVKKMNEQTADEIINDLKNLKDKLDAEQQEKWDEFTKKAREDNEKAKSKDINDTSLYNSDLIKFHGNDAFGIYPIREIHDMFEAFMAVIAYLTQNADLNKISSEIEKGIEAAIDINIRNRTSNDRQKPLELLNGIYESVFHWEKIPKNKYIEIGYDHGDGKDSTSKVGFVHILKLEELLNATKPKTLSQYVEEYLEFSVTLHKTLYNIKSSSTVLLKNFIKFSENTDFVLELKNKALKHQPAESFVKSNPGEETTFMRSIDSYSIFASRQLFYIAKSIVNIVTNVEHNAHSYAMGVRRSRKKMLKHIHRTERIHEKFKNDTNIDRFKRIQKAKKAAEEKRKNEQK